MLGAVPNTNTRASAAAIGPKLQTSGDFRSRFAIELYQVAV
jgi:hypothetical protein